MPSRHHIWWARLGYPQLLEPKAAQSAGQSAAGGPNKPRYTTNLHIVDNNDPIILELQKAIFAAWQEFWPDPTKRPFMSVKPGEPMTWFNKNHATQEKSPGLRVPLVWGPAEWPDDPHASGWVLLASAPGDKPRPVLAYRPPGAPEAVPLPDPTMVFGGAEARRATVDILGYSKAGGMGILAGLNGVEFSGRNMGRYDSKPTMADLYGEEGDAPPPPPAPEGAEPPMPAGQPDPFSSGTPPQEGQPDPFGGSSSVPPF